MRYTIYKMYFSGGVHFGRNSLENSEYTFGADTLFSALCQEAVKESSDNLEQLLSYVRNRQLLVSDAFPFINDTYYLPKPFLYIDTGEKKGDSGIKKAYKKMKYIPADLFDEYLKGEFPTERMEDLGHLGNTYRKVSASIRGEEETKPFRVGTYYYNQGNGLYIIVGAGNQESEGFLEEMLEKLSYSGIGGKRSSGLGRFELYKAAVPDELERRLSGSWEKYMTLAVSLPKEEEMENALLNANYSLVKRSGFVSSDTYAKDQMRKKDLFVFASGSCFDGKYSGDIYDVSNYGKHSVYRYAVPMFMGVDT